MDQKIVDKLVKKYGKIRCISTNPYDIYDLYNVEMNDLEICIFFIILKKLAIIILLNIYIKKKEIENTMIPN